MLRKPITKTPKFSSSSVISTISHSRKSILGNTKTKTLSKSISSLARTPVIQQHQNPSFQQRWIFGTPEEGFVHSSEEFEFPHLMHSTTPSATLDLTTGHRIEICQGDITKEKTQAIVNTANEHLLHMNGVAHEIAKAGGVKLRDESEAWVQQNGPLRAGEVAVTSSGALGPHPIEYVFHAVAPMWKGGEQNEEVMMYDTVWNCLRKATELQLRSIALPCLSEGPCRFPKDTCANILFQSVADYCRSQLDEPEKHPHLIRVINVDDISTRVYVRMLKETHAFDEIRKEK